MKSVLIAHQSTIPHYRVPFYNALERLRPAGWYFDVVFDSRELTKSLFFKRPIGAQSIQFPTLDTSTWIIDIWRKRITYQTFWREASKYDLLVLEHALNNLTYPLCQIHQGFGVKVAYWGHGEDRNTPHPSGIKAIAERTKVLLARKADGFFAYTSGVEAHLRAQGLSSEKIFSVNNTIDIERQREAFTHWRSKRDSVRRDLGIQGKKVLLFVGRLTANKRLPFLLEALSCIRESSPDFHLLLVGSGRAIGSGSKPDNVSFLGTIIDLDELAAIYAASDVFAYPGAVGLAPLQALCYDLPVVWIEAVNHKPEVQYLSPLNSVMLSASTTPADYAQAIIDLFDNRKRLQMLRERAWPSIRHLTIEQMAENFIRGVNAILGC